jgi:PiT family inorganic phosphate transporter
MILVFWFMSTVLVPYEDIKKPRFDSHLYSFLCEPTNIKWFLVGIVFYSLAIFNMFFSRLSTAKAEAVLRKMQLLSSAAFSLGHGGNDSQKVMGIIAAAVAVYIKTNPNVDMSIGWLDLNVVLPSEKDGIKIDGHMPEWIPLTCYTVIALGTLRGGWKIQKTSIYDTHDCWFYYWCWNHQKNLSSTMGNYRKTIVGLDIDDSSFSNLSCFGLLFIKFVFINHIKI